MASLRTRRTLAEDEKCHDTAKARARALELLAGRELSSGMLYERLCRRFTGPAAAGAVAEMVELGYVDDARCAEALAHAALCAHKSRRAAAEYLRQKGIGAQEAQASLDAVYSPDECGESPELAAAAALVEKHYRSKLNSGRRDLVMAALLRRGFDYKTAAMAIDASD